MKEMKSKKDLKSKKELRNFGLVIAAPLFLIGGVLFWNERGSAESFFIIAGVLVFLALMSPRVLTPFEKLWMKFADVLSVVMTFVILTLTFFFVITPIGILLRVLRKDLLKLKMEPGKESYWEEVEVDGPSTRYYTPY